MKNIAYIFGAGASYNSIPIANTLNKALHLFKDILEKVHNRFNIQSISAKALADYNSVCSVLDDFLTIDTYARQLFLQKRFTELEQLKRVLVLYFVVWQFIDDKQKSVLSLNRVRICPDGSMLDGKAGRELKHYSNYDQRYISLLAGLEYTLLDEKLKHPDNVNFISWNYDYQFEMSLDSLLGERADYTSYPRDYFEDMTNPFIVHLNGVAGIAHSKAEYKSIIDEVNIGPFHKVIPTVLEMIYDDEEIKLADMFSYSWEDGIHSSFAVDYAKKIVDNSDVLIVIGYSFPFFNRKVDLKILHEGEFERVILQDPNFSQEDATRLKDNFAWNTEPEVINKVDMFYTPIEL